MHRYETILYWDDRGHAFITEVPELPGCMAHGDSQETALRNIYNVIRFWIDKTRALGRPVTKPKGERLMLA